MNRNVLIAAAVLLVAAVGVYLAFGQTGEPDQQAGAPLVDVVVPELTAAQKEGEAAFNRFCIACHGENAAGQDGVAPPLVHRIYEPSHHGDIAFQMAAMNGVRAHHWPFGNMQPVEGVTEQDVAKIVTYVRALQRANGIE